MDYNSSNEMTMDSIDETIFEDFYCLDITLPFISDHPIETPSAVISSSSSSLEKLEKEPEEEIFSVLSTSPKTQLVKQIPLVPVPEPQVEMEQTMEQTMEPEKEMEQTFSVFSTNLSNLRANKTPSTFKQPLITFSPAVVPQQQKSSILGDPIFSPVNESTENKSPIESFTPKRPETPTDLDKTLVLKQISARTNQSPLYTPVTSMVSRFRNLALESPYPLSNINNKPKLETPKTKENSPVKKPTTGQHQTRLEKVKLVSPLLRSPKFRPVSTRLPFQSNSKATNPNSKKSPTIAQYKANPPVNQGSRIPVLKLI